MVDLDSNDELYYASLSSAGTYYFSTQGTEVGSKVRFSSTEAIGASPIVLTGFFTGLGKGAVLDLLVEGVAASPLSPLAAALLVEAFAFFGEAAFGMALGFTPSCFKPVRTRLYAMLENSPRRPLQCRLAVLR